MGKDKYMREYNQYCEDNNFQPKSQRGVTTEFSYTTGIGTKDKCYTGLKRKTKRDKTDLTADYEEVET